MQVGVAVARAAAGRWSYLRDDGIQLFRRLAGALLLAAAALAGAPDAIAVPGLMAGGVAA